MKYECGLVKFPNQKGFIEFQRKAIEQWDFFEIKNKKLIDVLQTPDDIINELLGLIV